MRLYKNRLKESVIFEITLILYLNEHGYPCPVLCSNKYREYIGVYKQKPFAIFEFIEGEHLEQQTEFQKNQLIHMVAELQNITMDFIPLNSESRWNYSLGFCIKLARMEADKSNLKSSNKKREWVEDEISKLRISGDLPKGICHCDFHYTNILYRNGQFKALLDFDDSNYTYLIFDLVCLINLFISGFDWDSWENYSVDDDVF